MTETPRVLYFDIETSPILAYTFSLWKPVIGLEQIVEEPRVLCWSAKWHHDRRIMFDSEYHSDRDTMLKGMRDLLDQADVVVGYNSKSFDVPWMTTEFLTAGIEPPSPFQQIDLYRTNKRFLRMASGKLDYLAWRVLEERKVTHSGFRLWKDCIGPDGPAKDKAWKEMKRYALKDTALLQPLYEALRPYTEGYNMALLQGKNFGCTRCGSTNLQSRGTYKTTTSSFQRYYCSDCGGWSRAAKRIDTTELRPIT